MIGHSTQSFKPCSPKFQALLSCSQSSPDRIYFLEGRQQYSVDVDVNACSRHVDAASQRAISECRAVRFFAPKTIVVVVAAVVIAFHEKVALDFARIENFLTDYACLL